ncbi:MAG: alpha/beta hydrolase [Deltaproteobacteria bacterium]|nr:alpha/beta hydrolase [Deltaproteobacteria bacterium]
MKSPKTVNLPVLFSHHYANLKGVRLHYVTCGRGPAVVLLHGWPQTWFEWRIVMPLLANDFTLVAPDLRGLGDSSRPKSGYDKKTVAGDIWQLMNGHLGHERFAVVGHDWGSAVAFRVAADHPAAVTHLALLDVPVIGSRPPADGGGLVYDRWHHHFHQVPDLPEALVVGRERTYLEFFFKNGCDVAGVFPDDVIDEYVRAYAQPGAMRAGFNFYRATRQDWADNRALFDTGFRLTMPTLGLGGGGERGRGNAVVASLRQVADQVDGGSVPDCGHFIPEEKPAELAQLLRDFLINSRSKARPVKGTGGKVRRANRSA